MLIAVVGTSGLGRVAGVSTGSPAALLRVVADRPDTEVVVLSPEHLVTTAQRQADLVAAARPAARVSVITSSHHALTLTVIADRVLTANPWLTGTDELRGLLRTEMARAHSLIWSPAAWRLRGVRLGVGARLRSLFGGRSQIFELAPHRSSSSDGWHPADDDRVFLAGPVPAPLRDLLIVGASQRVDTHVEDSRHTTGSACLLTALPRSAAERAEVTTDAPVPAPLETPLDGPRPAVVSRESEAA